jgi:hypothetical protein
MRSRDSLGIIALARCLAFPLPNFFTYLVYPIPMCRTVLMYRGSEYTVPTFNFQLTSSNPVFHHSSINWIAERAAHYSLQLLKSDNGRDLSGSSSLQV